MLYDTSPAWTDFIPMYSLKKPTQDSFNNISLTEDDSKQMQLKGMEAADHHKELTI